LIVKEVNLEEVTLDTMVSSFALTVILWTGARVRFAILGDAGFETFMKELSLWAPDTDFSNVEFYVRERLIQRGIPFASQGVGEEETLLAIPAGCTGTKFPEMAVLSTRAGIWAMKPAYVIPMYLRVHYNFGEFHDLLIESCSNETIETLKNTVISKSGRSYNPSCDEIKLEVDGNPLTESTVGACGLTSGSQIAFIVNPIRRPFIHGPEPNPDGSVNALAIVDYEIPRECR
jgi:hypothetical protein